MPVKTSFTERNPYLGDKVIIREFGHLGYGFALHDEPDVRVIVPLGTQLRMHLPVMKSGGAECFKERSQVIAEVKVLSLELRSDKNEKTILSLREIRGDNCGEIISLPQDTPILVDESA